MNEEPQGESKILIYEPSSSGEKPTPVEGETAAGVADAINEPLEPALAEASEVAEALKKDSTEDAQAPEETETPQPQESLKKKAFKGVFWKIGEQGGKQLIAFTLGVIIARLVAPEQFGVIAMFTIFTSVAGIFVDSGFATALFRKNNRTHVDCCTVFYFNITLSLIAYAILFLIAPWVAEFYNMPEVCPVMRVVSLTLPIGALCGVHSILFEAEMRFAELTKFNLLSLVVSGVVGVILAYKGFQVWALVAQQMLQFCINSLIIWLKSHWRPTLEFSFQSIKEFFGFGWKMVASSLLDTVYGNMYSLVIGKFYTASDLAYYNRANNQRNLVSAMPTGILQSVTFPTLTKLQDDYARLREGYRRTLRISAFVIFPMCVGLAAVSYPFISVLYTDVWLETAHLQTILLFASMWYPIHAINLNLLIVKGHSGFFLKLEVIKKIIGAWVMVITIFFGLTAMCYGMVASSILCLAINTYYTKKLINLGLWDQMRDLMPTLLLCAAMFVAVKAWTIYWGLSIVSLVGGVIIGIAVYAGGALLFRFNEVKELKNWNK